MKKLSALILCLAVMLSCAVPVFADELTSITVTAEQTEAAPGDTVDFTVTIKATEGCRTLGLILKYDSAVFEVVEGQCSSGDALVSTFAPNRGFIMLFAKAVKLDGEICTFTLKVRDAAAAGTYDVGLKASMKNTDDPIETEVTPASVTIVREGGKDSDPKPTEAPNATEPPRETEPPKETEAPKQTEPPKETDAPKETEVPKETESIDVTEAVGSTDAPTEPQSTPTTPEIPEETPAPETQAPTEVSTLTEPAEEVPQGEFKLPLWAIVVYAVGFLAIIVILILKRRQK